MLALSAWPDTNFCHENTDEANAKHDHVGKFVVLAIPVPLW